MVYASILERFKQRLPNVRSVVFCDYEGEAVEFLTDLDSFHTQLLGAYQAEMLHDLAKAGQLVVGALLTLSIKTEGTHWSIFMLKDGYYVVTLSRGPVPNSHPAVRTLLTELSAEL